MLLIGWVLSEKLPKVIFVYIGFFSEHVESAADLDCESASRDPTGWECWLVSWTSVYLSFLAINQKCNLTVVLNVVISCAASTVR